MKITTRIAAGLFLMAGLLIGVLAYQLTLTERLQRINRELSLASIEAAQISIRLGQRLEGVKEFATKVSLLRDPGTVPLWREWEASVERAMTELARVELGEEEDRHRRRIEAGWANYRKVAAGLEENPDLLIPVTDTLVALQSEVQALIDANGERVTEHAASSVRAGEEAWLVARVAALVALLLAGAISFTLFFSISGPLRRLTQGTRELARGRFKHRLEESGPAELAALAGDFNQMATRLDEIEDLKRDFVSHVSHELKTPLAAIYETIEVFLERIPGPLTPTQEHLLQLSRKSSKRLATMIGNLLQTSRLEAGAAVYDPAQHDLGEIADSVMEEMQTLAEEREITLLGNFSEGSHLLLCDDERVREVVTNLIGNALKFAPEGSTVRIRIGSITSPPQSCPISERARVEEEEGPFFLLSVEDEGTGVADDHKESIFNKFHQVGGQGRIQGQGVGLGLAICRKIVHGHGGAIWVEDCPGGGALFQVLLPVLHREWKGAQPNQEDRPIRGKQDTRVVSRPGISAGAVLLFPILIATGGCSIIPGIVRPAPEARAAEAPAAEPGNSAGIESLPPSPAVPEISLEEGRRQLESGAFGGAAVTFRQISETALPGSDKRNEALWGLALTYLLRESPLYNPTEGTALLTTLASESPTDSYGLQASLLRQTLLELSDARRQLRERDALLEDLNEMLETYRRIDQNRRPAP